MAPGGVIAVAVAAAATGAVAGTALCIPAYRLSVPWGEPNLRACAGCQREFPAGARGWLRFGASCPGCRARLGPRPWLLAVLAAVACGGIVARFGATPQALPYLALIPLGCLLGAIDLACLRLPEALTLPGLAGSVLAYTALAAGTGTWRSLGQAVLGGLAFGAAYLVLALLPGGQLGLGDVTLGVLLGVHLGWLGWPVVVLGAILPFAVNAPVALWVLIARRAGRKAELPFGPAMLVGAYLAVVGPALLVAVLGL